VGRGSRGALVASLSIFAAIWLPASPASADGSRCPITGVDVPAGADIQWYLNAGAPGTAFCLESGIYTPSATLVPQSGQSLYGVPGSTVLDGGGSLSFILDGAGTQVTGVGVYDLTLQNGANDVRTWTDWVLDDVSAIRSSQIGVTLNGSNVTIQNGSIEYNGVFGIRSSQTVGGVVQNNVIAYNNSSSNNPGYSGATHFNDASGLQVLNNTVHDNYGRGIWFDIGSTGSLIQGNTVYNEINYTYNNIPFQVGDGIRDEISCYDTIKGNTVYANQGPQIPIDGSDHATVTGNTVSAPAGSPGIRVAPQDKRLSGNIPPIASKYCDQTPNTAVYDAVSGNSITLAGHTASLDYSGVQQTSAASNTTGATFDANAYHVPGCGYRLWHWWDPNLGSLVKVSFATFRSTYGQELNGTCSTQ
jgi:hypothetical protein